MKWVYAALCILGVALPYYFFLPFLLENGLDIPLIASQIFADPLAAFFAADVIVSSLALWALIYHETRTQLVRLWWLAVLANLVAGDSLGLPLFLLLREIERES